MENLNERMPFQRNENIINNNINNVNSNISRNQILNKLYLYNLNKKFSKLYRYLTDINFFPKLIILSFSFP